MYYYKARMYSPTLGRFMQTDPIGYGDGTNMYAYVGNDPVNGVDPTGLDCAGISIATCTTDVNGNTWALGGVGVNSEPIWSWYYLGRDNSSMMGSLTWQLNSSRYTPDYAAAAALAGFAASMQQINICEVGNSIMEVSDKAGDASLALTGTGLLIAGGGVVTAQPEVVAAGGAVATVGGVFGIGSGALQVVGGLAQGIGGGGYKNFFAGTVSLGSGVIVSKVLRATIPRGWHGASRAAAERNNSIVGHVASALQGTVDWLSPTQASCPE